MATHTVVIDTHSVHVPEIVTVHDNPATHSYGGEVHVPIGPCDGSITYSRMPTHSDVTFGFSCDTGVHFGW